MKNKISAFLIALVLLCCMPLQVFAAQSVPDLSAKGSITFLMRVDGKDLDGGKMNIVRVGEFDNDGEDYFFRLLPSLGGTVLSSKNLTDPAFASNLLVLSKNAKLEKTVALISKGKAVFSNLPMGLYLVWQDSNDATEGYSPIQPFLISIPQLDGTKYIQDIVSKPKVPIETKPSEPPTPPPPPPPPPPELPPTGQLNWPIPVMGAAGFMLFVYGLILDIREKRAENEK